MLYQNVTKTEMSKILGFSINTINSGLDAFIQARAKNGIKITEVGKEGILNYLILRQMKTMIIMNGLISQVLKQNILFVKKVS